MRALDVMSKAVYKVTPLTTVREAAVLMRDHNIGFLPVVADGASDTLVGVVTDRDLVIRGLADGPDIDRPVRLVMSVPPLVVARESTEVHQLLALMEQHQVRRVPIVSADGAIWGIVSQGDLAVRLGPMEPLAIESLMERVSTPSWLVQYRNGDVRPEWIISPTPYRGPVDVAPTVPRQ